jgi:hypothetical protein
MTAAPNARRKAIRSDAAHRSATTRCVPLRLTLGSQQPPGKVSTLFPLVQLSANALLPVAATMLFPHCSIPATPAVAKSP